MRFRTGCILAVPALALLLSAGSAQAQRQTNIDGNKLLEICTNRDTTLRRQCESYIDGVSDTITAYQQRAAASKTDEFKVPNVACVPATVSGPQLADTVTNWLRSKPQERHRRAVTLVMLALREKFPCK